MKGKYKKHGILLSVILAVILLFVTACAAEDNGTATETIVDTPTVPVVTEPTETTPPMETETTPPMETETTPPMETETTPPMETETTPPAETETTPPAVTETTPPAETETPTATPTETVTPTETTPAATEPPLGTVEVLGVWGGSELESFQEMIAPWEQETGGRMNFTGTRDLTAILTTRLQAGNPPDIAILPNPGLMRQYAAQNYLIPLNDLADIDMINEQYPEAWVELGTVDGELYAIFMKATNKGMVWYNPAVFEENEWEIPETWDDMIQLSDDIVAAGGTPPAPWAMGVESGAATGWPGTDWIAQIFLSQYGGEAYDQWINHEIPWTDSRIRDAWEAWGTIVFTEGYVPGGAVTVLSTNFQDASYWPFMDPPQAAMYYQGDFVQGFITAQFPDAVAGEDFDFFPFPSISPDFEGAVTGGADLVVVFNDTPTVRSFLEYVASADAQQIWVERGGFTSVNSEIDLEAYPDDISRNSAEQLLDASLFRFGAGDSMPSAVQTAWWNGIQRYLQNPDELDAILQDIEETAQTAYENGTGNGNDNGNDNGASDNQTGNGNGA